MIFKNKRIPILVFISTICLLYSCTKETADLRSSDFEIPIVEGYYVRDPMANIIGMAGNPNVRLVYNPNPALSTRAYSLIVYPNPCKEICAIAVVTQTGNEPKKIWITKAAVSEQFAKSSIDLNMVNMYVGGSPVKQFETDSDNIHIDTSTFDEGYYRVYIKVGDVLLYDNLVVYKQKN